MSDEDEARILSDLAGQARGGSLPELTVSELSGALKKTIETAFPFVRVRGELGRVTLAKSGHLYFDLKDASAAINVVMWKGQAQRLPFRPEEGQEVLAEGRLSTFPGRSNYQLICDSLRPAGAGALMQLLEERRRRLAAEGLFDAARKKPIPYLPQVIGVVTSPTGAVIRDILHRVAERFPVRVLIWPALVQGEKASFEVEAGIRGFNALPTDGPIPRPDVLIVARGGGSIEDLWPFNEERVVRAAAESVIPLISAVGHETDTTLIDYAADRRAPTPTAAAEMAVPVRLDLLETVGVSGARLSRLARSQLRTRALELSSLARRMPRLDAVLNGPRQRLDIASHRFQGALGRALGRKRVQFEMRAARLQPAALRRDALRRRQLIDRLAQRLSPAFSRNSARRSQRLEQASRMLESLSFEAALRRGFSLVTRGDGALVRSALDVRPGDRLRLRFADGEAQAVGGEPGTDGAPEMTEAEASPSPKGRSRRGSGGVRSQGDLF